MAVANGARTTNKRVILVVVLALWLRAQLLDQGPYWKIIYQDKVDPQDLLARGAELAAVTQPDDRVVFEGFTWSPEMPYYSHRTGIMLTDQILTPRVLDSLPSQRYDALVSAGFGPATADVLNRWHWISTPSPHVYYLATRAEELRLSRLVAGNDLDAVPPASETVSMIPEHQTLPCVGRSIAVPTQSRWTWMRFDANSSQGVMVDQAGAAIVPAHRLVIVPPGIVPSNSPLHVRCFGGGVATLTMLVDGPAPDGMRAG